MSRLPPALLPPLLLLELPLSLLSEEPHAATPNADTPSTQLRVRRRLNRKIDAPPQWGTTPEARASYLFARPSRGLSDRRSGPLNRRLTWRAQELRVHEVP